MTYSPKHTPGPWNYSGPCDIGRDTYSIYGSGPLAYTAGPSDYGDAAEANARLIAAAPKLLKILEGFLATLVEPDDDKAAVVESYYDANFELWSAAMNVFQEATGEEEGQL